jgi:hypothetical protein
MLYCKQCSCAKSSVGVTANSNTDSKCAITLRCAKVCNREQNLQAQGRTKLPAVHALTLLVSAAQRVLLLKYCIDDNHAEQRNALTYTSSMNIHIYRYYYRDCVYNVYFKYIYIYIYM